MENLNQRLESLIRFRKELHKNPELSGKEIETAKRIVSFLGQYPPDEMQTNIGGTGIIAVYKGADEGKSILFRCELDALPIKETNSFEHKSVKNTISHKCGHDGHMAILCGLASELHHQRPEKGNVILLFQPAEENGSGAEKVANDDNYKNYKPDYVFALHNLPGFDKNQIVVKDGTFSCAVKSMIIRLKGKIAHAAEPENGINPALAIASIIQKFDEKNQVDKTKPNFSILTPIYISLGEKAYGVSAGKGEAHFTIRCQTNKEMEKLSNELENLTKEIAKNHQLEYKIKWTESFQANENNADANNFIKNASKILGLNVLEKDTPFSWGEDFGLFTQLSNGAMFGLGAGKEIPALHHSDYDFPDEIISTGVKLFHQISKEINNAH
ncbi:MAG TPA: amidohydrolase [Flavobacterium sp.]|uniref:amidohydrolase n=1 Tax=unclassified Flavobacterium TaxID=196869 RepID=UPI000E8CF713|nr:MULTISPECIES: amidohydrolase [unclassified Flavobacterium]HBI02070.1 amidohydrolase [Flavobacterium sp.]HRE77129.1 amidohydrolase [Flavobacterium sp.]